MPHTISLYQYILTSLIPERGYNNIYILDCLLNALDLNTVENIFHILTSKVYGENKRFKKYNSLQEELVVQCEKLDSQLFQKVYESMLHRLLEVIENKGGITKY